MLFALSMFINSVALGVYSSFNTLRPKQNGRHFFTDDMFKRIFSNENVWIAIKISLKFVPKGPINKIPALFQIMVWRRPGDKPLSEAMLVSLLTHKCVTRPQWVKSVGLLTLKIWLDLERIIQLVWYSVAEKLSWSIRHLSDGLYIFCSNLWNLSSEI